MRIRNSLIALLTGVLLCLAALPALASEMEGDVVDDNCFFLSTSVETDFATTVENVKAGLKDVGFGVLWETDLQKIMKEKLSADIPPYLILGACNPAEAQKALAAEPWIGTLMPCNIVVRQDAQGKVWVGAKHPDTIADSVGDDEIYAIAEELTATLTKVLAGL